MKHKLPHHFLRRPTDTGIACNFPKDLNINPHISQTCRTSEVYAFDRIVLSLMLKIYAIKGLGTCGASGRFRSK